MNLHFGTSATVAFGDVAGELGGLELVSCDGGAGGYGAGGTDGAPSPPPADGTSGWTPPPPSLLPSFTSLIVYAIQQALWLRFDPE